MPARRHPPGTRCPRASSTECPGFDFDKQQHVREPVVNLSDRHSLARRVPHGRLVARQHEVQTHLIEPRESCGWNTPPASRPAPSCSVHCPTAALRRTRTWQSARCTSRGSRADCQTDRLLLLHVMLEHRQDFNRPGYASCHPAPSHRRRKRLEDVVIPMKCSPIFFGFSLVNESYFSPGGLLGFDVTASPSVNWQFTAPL